jgi:hypoxia up-regulated 1
MGGMDTEVTIAKYSVVKASDNKISQQIEILAETSVRDLGSKDIDIVLVNLLAEKFNELPERIGKEDVRGNVKSTKRLLKEVVKIKEVLSANHEANVKVPDLLDYVSL